MNNSHINNLYLNSFAKLFELALNPFDNFNLDFIHYIAPFIKNFERLSFFFILIFTK